MEWVETTGPTVEAALDAALDELGVDEEEVEYEVLQAPKSGLFGRIGAAPARIRARVKPISREKPGERGRGRGRQGRGRQGGSRGGRGDGNGGGSQNGNGAKADRPASGGGDRPAEKAEGATGERSGGSGRSRNRGRGGRGGGGGQGGNGGQGGRPAAGQESTGRREPAQAAQKAEKVDTVNTSESTTEEVPVGVQADVADEFMRGLVAAFGLAGEVSVRIEDDSVFVDVDGADLGLLVGPKGATLKAVEELVRTVVQRSTDGHGARIHVDVGGYQAKRRAALAKFATELAERVRDSGSELALEPMSASDRKVVHDTIAAMDGVTTTSEGDEPRRRVVVRPA